MIVIASPGAIIGGARAAHAATPSGQGALTTPNPTGPSFGQISPLVSQLGGGPQAGYAPYGGNANAFLPRPGQDFAAGAFGPFTPILPVPVDQPPDGAPRAMPRRLPYQVGWNLPIGQPGTEGVKLADFQTLRSIGSLYSVARACIQLLKSEIRGLEWDIIPTKDAAKAMRGDHKAMIDFGERRAKAVAFFKNPDPEYGSWNSWLDTLLEDFFVIDATSVYLRPTWGKGKGVLGSDLCALELIAGETIRPLFDLHGSRPMPPAPAYQCYSSDTELLTRRGWLTFDQVRIDDDIASRSAEGRFMWQRPMGITLQQYEGDLIRFHGRAADLLVTPNHRMLWSRNAQERVSRAEEIEHIKGAYLVATSTWDAPDMTRKVFQATTRAARGPAPREVTMTGDQFAAFMGMWLSEGSTAVRPNDWRVIISQSQDKGKGYLEYQDVLTGIFGREPGRNGESWVISSRALYDYLAPLGKATTKQIPREILDLSARQLAIFWHFYWLGDGSTASGQQQVVATASKAMADGLQEVVQKLGWSASVREEKCKGNIEVPGERIIYKIGVRKTKCPAYNTTRVPYAGPVGCVQVPSGIVYVRRNGQPMWCGNSYIWGVPRVDLMQIITQSDLSDELKAGQVGEYRGDQLFYMPYTRRTVSPYGFPPIEQALVPIMSGLGKQQFQLDFYREGSIPGLFISPGDVNMTPSQIRELQDALNALAGDVGFKHKVIVLPPGSKTDPQKPTALADQFDEVIMSEVCMAFNVMPMELGLTPKVSQTQSVGAANQMSKMSQDVHARKSLIPTLQFLKESLFDKVLQIVCEQDDLQWMPEGLEQDEDEETLTGLLVTQIGAGLSSIDEARAELNRDPWGIPVTSDPLWASAQGVIPLGAMDPATGKPQDVTPAVPGQPAMPGQVGGPPPGSLTPGQPGAQKPSPPGAKPAAKPAAPPAGGGGPQAGAGNAGQTPAHSAGEAGAAVHADQRGQGPQTATAVGKAAWAELDALERHLRKGRDVATWEPRHIGGKVLDVVRFDLGDGQSITTAVADAKAELAKSA